MHADVDYLSKGMKDYRKQYLEYAGGAESTLKMEKPGYEQSPLSARVAIEKHQSSRLLNQQMVA